MKILIPFLFLFTTFSANAATATYFTCSNVGEIDEWTISIDLEKNEAGFFDNNSWTILPIKSKRVLESMPPQEEYFFEGQDTGNGGNTLMRIYFNKTKKKASLLMDVGTTNEARYEAKDGCRKISSREM
jgi:hypothetical protein